MAPPFGLVFAGSLGYGNIRIAQTGFRSGSSRLSEPTVGLSQARNLGLDSRVDDPRPNNRRYRRQGTNDQWGEPPTAPLAIGSVASDR